MRLNPRSPINALAWIALIAASSGCAKDSGETAGANVAPTPCPVGYQHNGQSCVPAAACPVGQQWNGQACVVQQTCPAGQQWNGQACTTVQTCPAGQVWNGQSCVAASTGGTNSGGTAAPPTIPLGAAHPPATPVDVSVVPAARAPIDLKAAQLAPGATPVGTLMVGQFQTGQALVSAVQMQPGKCYSVIAEAVPGGVSELNIELLPEVSVPGLGSPVLAHDKSTGPSAVLGAHPNCQKNPLLVAAPMKVVVWAAAGSGIAAAQVYER